MQVNKANSTNNFDDQMKIIPSHIINSINEGVLQIDLKGNIVYANNKLAQLTGYTYNEVIGKNAIDFLDTHNLKIFTKIISDRTKGISGRNELSLKVKNGENKPFSINGAPVKNKNGEIIGSISTFIERSGKNNETQNNDTRLKEILGNVNVAFWIYSIATKKIEFLSPGIENIYETELDQIYNANSIRKFIHPEDLKNVIIKNRKSLHTGGFEIEYRIITPTGKIKWIHDKAFILRDEFGKTEKIIGYVQEITKLKNTAENLIKSEKEKENIMNSIPYSFVTINSNYEIIKSYFKLSEKPLLNTGLKFLEGKTIEKVINKEIVNTIINLTERSNKNKETIKNEIEVLINEQIFWFEINICFMNNNSTLIILRNITSTKSNILKIQKLFNITEQTQDLIVITDITGKIEYVNPMFTSVTGYEANEVINNPINLLKSNKHPNTFYKKMWLTLTNKKPFKANFINRKKNGEFYVEEKIITPFININGEITNFISTCRNLGSEQKVNTVLKKDLKNEFRICDDPTKNGSRSLIQKQESDQKKLAKKLHEGLNQMLSAVRMNLESLNLNSGLSGSERNKIDFVSDALAEIMQELRGISGNLSPMGLYEFGLHPSINQLVNKLNKSNKSIKFILNSNIEGLRFKNEIEINYYRIIQEVLTNVIIHSGATITEIELFYNEKGLWLHVKDNGKGINKRTFNKIKMKKLGILNIEERVKSILSTFIIQTKPKAGFEILLKTKTKSLTND